MRLDANQRSEIERGLAIAHKLPEFATSDLWLTYYLTAAPAALRELAGSLAVRQCVNLRDEDGGFLYPKQPCGRDGGTICAQIEEILSLCEKSAVEMINVDLDASPNVERSAFHTLIEFS